MAITEIDLVGSAGHDIQMIAGVLLDLSGVIYVGNEPLPGALDAIACLRKMALSIRFLTNTIRAPKRRILQNLRDMELSCDDDELFTPARAARDWLTSRKLSAHLLTHPGLVEDFDKLPRYGRTAVVVGDAGKAFTCQTLNAAFRQLTNGAELLALASNRTFLDKDGKLSLDAGAFVAAMEYSAQKNCQSISPNRNQSAVKPGRQRWSA